MQIKSYEIPKAYRIILKSLQSELKQSKIEPQSFLEYCLAVFLFAPSQYRVKMFNSESARLLYQLIKKNKYEITKSLDGYDTLTGISSSIDASERVKILELFINYFSMHQSLKKKNYLTIDNNEDVYGLVCDLLKELREEIEIPLHLEQRTRSSNHGIGNGLLINVEMNEEFYDLLNV